MLVEDNRGDVLLIREALEAANLDTELYVVSDGEKAIRFFEELDGDESLVCPALVIIDINLPKKQGSEVLQRMRSTRRCGKLRALVVTSSDSAKDRESMARFGIDGYFCKPSQYDAFMKLGKIVKDLLPSKSS